ncbi:MAG TPA: glycosyltransferase [Lacunisphaera sp.]|nr:glycosyltransferase [Lacunisphaera sp.]
MPRVLIISPHFPPVNAPDMQRVRMSLPYFVDAGWEIVVLTVDDKASLAPLEPGLLETVPAPVRVVRAPVLSRRWTRWFGVNSLGLRALLGMYFRGRRLLAAESFDLVYFSTTQFVICALGRLWHGQCGVPYVIDLQDPWLSDYYDQPGAPRPPGGWKYRFARGLARLLEGWTLRRAAHVISVSSHYLGTLRERYPWFRGIEGSVVTFGVPDADLQAARRQSTTTPHLLPASAGFRIAYAGRLGPDMRPALDALFAAVARFKDAPRPYEIYFFGTSYAAAGQGVATTTDLAARHGISHLVHEQPARIGYLDSLRVLLETDLVLVLGSEDRAYSPSKFYPTLLAARPALVIAPFASVLEAKVRELGGAALISFEPREPLATATVEAVATVLAAFADHPAAPLGPPANLAAVEREYSAAAIARRQLEIFTIVVRRTASNPCQPGEGSDRLIPPAP